jgi:tetratricopeptide (TPR) repeat protein
MSNRRRTRRNGSQQRSRAGRDAYTAGRDQTIINVEASKGQSQAPGLMQRILGQVVFGEIPKRPPAFQERESLHRAITSAGNLAVISTLAGARGIGKSQLAAAYARECIDAGWKLVAWIGAERSDQVLAGLDQLAKAMNLREDGDDSEAAAAKVRQWLEKPGDEKSLVVFDNATDPDFLTRWLPSAGSARILITSNRRSFDSLGTLIDVDVFTSAEAHAYLMERTSLQDAAGAAALGEEVGRLPLALAQASGVIRAQRLSYADFLDRLQKVSLDKYLKRQPGDDYPRGAAETVILALQQAERDGKLARSLLLALSVLSPDGVSRELLYAAGAEGAFNFLPWQTRSGVRVTPPKIDAALEKLAEASLVTYSIDGEAVIMHRFTQRVSRERASREPQLDLILLKVSQMIDRQRAADEPSWKRREEIDDLINQISSIWDNAQIRFTSDTKSILIFRRRFRSQFEKLLVSLRIWSVRELIDMGNPRRAVQLGMSVASDCGRVLGPDHPGTFASRDNLAVAYVRAGRHDEAIGLHRQVVADRARVLGPDHPTTLASRNSLALAYHDAGRHDEAIGLHRQIVADRERVLGPDHPDTLSSRNNLATAYHHAGRHDEAIGLHRQVVADQERVLGPDHPTTLASRNNLAHAYHHAGRHDEAIELQRQVIADEERVLGLDHPTILASRNNLAGAYSEAGRHVQAIDLYRQAIADQERVLGPDHPTTLTSRNNLAGAYTDAGRLDKAIDLFRQTIADRARVLGPDHPDTLRSRNNLATALRKRALQSHRPGGWRPKRLH